MRNRGPLFFAQLAFTLLVCAFLIVPVILSMLAGLTVNYQVGIQSGLTLRWVVEVWSGYRDTIFLSIGIALACLACTLVLGVPTAYVLAKRQSGAGPRARGTAGDAGGRAGPGDRAGADHHLRRLPAASAPPGSSSWSAMCCSPCRSWCARCWRC